MATPLRLIAFAALLLCAALPLAASSSNVVPAHTGGFGEMTCQQCHWENPLNEPSGRLTIEGLPDSYTPGEQYLITVTLARPGLMRGGFQLSAREDEMAMNAGKDAGSLRAVDMLAQTVQDDAKRVTYAQHTRVGSDVSTPGVSKWQVQWTAPDARVRVIFHVAANASNDDASPLGDYIYTATVNTR